VNGPSICVLDCWCCSVPVPRATDCCHRASDLKREVGAAIRSSAKAAEALRVAQEGSCAAQSTIEQLRADLKLIRDDFVACQESLEMARSESRTQFEEIKKSREEQRSAIVTAEAAQREAAEKVAQIRNLELELVAERARSAQPATQTQGEHSRHSSVDMEADGARKATRRRQDQQASLSYSVPSQSASRHQQPGLVITPEALNWCARFACITTRNLTVPVPSIGSLLTCIACSCTDDFVEWLLDGPLRFAMCIAG
jgi:hypothetical protein